MNSDRRDRLKELLRLGDDRILAVSRSGDKYFLVDDKTGAAERISVQAAAQLWLQDESEGWDRLDRPRSNPKLDAELDDELSFAEQLRRRLKMVEDE